MAGRGIRGRERELAHIESLLARIDVEPIAVMLEGEAGIGKTAVWTTVVDQIAARGWRVLRAQPVPPEMHLTFAGLSDLFASISHVDLDTLPTAQRRAIDAALLWSDDEEVDHRAVATAASRLLHEMSMDQPVILAIDDIQWLDAATLRIIQFAARRVGVARIGFLSARRRDLGEKPPGVTALRRVLGELRTELVQIGPLASEHVIELLDDEEGFQLPDATVMQVARVADGNPLYALELARGLHNERLPAPHEQLPLPDNIRLVMRRRLKPLDERTKRGLLVLALLGRPQPEVLERALAVADASLEAARSLFVVENDDEQRPRFTHPLLASVVVHEAGPELVRARHRELADVVDDVEQRARHLALGADEADEEVANELEAAAKVARARGAPETAAELLELAASLIPETQADERHRLRFAAAADLYNAGQVTHPRSLLEDVVAGLAPGPRRAEALGMLASVRFSSDSAIEAHRLVEQALAESEGDLGLTLTLEFTAAAASSVMGDFARARAHLDRARASAEELGITEAVDAARGFELMLQSPFAPEPHDAPKELPLPGGSDYMRANRLLWEGLLDEAREVLERVLADAIASGDDSSLPPLLQLLARVETWNGCLDRARAYGEEGLRITESTGRDALSAVVLGQLLHVSALQDDAGEARAAVTAALALVERTGSFSSAPDMVWARAVLDLSLGDVERAAEGFAAGREQMHSMGGGDQAAALRYLVDEIESLVLCGRIDEARTCLMLFPVEGRAAAVPWIRAAHARARGLIAASTGALEDALGDLQLAIELLQETPMRVELARSWLADGRVRRRAKQWGSARQSLKTALALFEEMNMPHWAAQARAELGRVGGRQPSGDELSATEQRVAVLVATGRTNREVADELFLSQKTVEWHLSRIYRKLGVRNRAELGATLARANTSD